MQKVEADDGHGYSQPRRQAAYRWFGHWLKSEEDDGAEQDVPPATSEELWATPTGQVSTSFQGEDVFSLNLKRYAAVRSSRPSFSLDQIKQVVAFAPASGELHIQTYGALERDGYRIEKLTYQSEPGVLIPALIYVPHNRPGRLPAIICADGEGKRSARQSAELLVRKGSLVMSIDARGFGETRPDLDTHDHFFTYFADHDDAETAILLGKTLVGMRAADISRGIDLLAARPDVDASQLSAIGRGAAAVAMLHAAAFDPRIRKLVVDEMLVSYDAIVTHRIHRQMFEQIVPSALKFYDLPDLADSLAPRPLWIINAVNPLGQVLPAPEVRARYARAQIHVTRGEGFRLPANNVLDEIFK